MDSVNSEKYRVTPEEIEKKKNPHLGKDLEHF